MEQKADRERLLRNELTTALRWTHPTLGSISPVEFIPATEASGLIVPIGQWVLEQACAEAVLWPNDVKVAVNLSPRQFAGFGLPADVAKSLSSTRLAPIARSSK